MTELHTMFEFDTNELAATNDLFQSDPWHGNISEKYNRWARAMAEIYNIPAPRVMFIGPMYAGIAGAYMQTPNGTGEIRLPKASVTTLFFCFHSHLGEHGFGRRSWLDNIGWAHSLYHACAPNSYFESLARGQLYLPPVEAE